VRVREAMPADAVGIARVRVDTWRTTYRGIVPDATLANLSFEENEKRWECQVQGGDGRFTYVVEDEIGEVVGFASGGPMVARSSP